MHVHICGVLHNACFTHDTYRMPSQGSPPQATGTGSPGFKLPTLAGDVTVHQAASAVSNHDVVTWRRPFQDKQNAQLRIESQMVHCLSHFVGIRTVSGDPQLHEEVFRGAKFLAGLLESVGMQVKLAQNVRTVHPCVLARLEICPSRPTLVFYGHYDVQPAQELVRILCGQSSWLCLICFVIVTRCPACSSRITAGLDHLRNVPYMQAWTTNPFIMTQKDGYLLGRGTSDNKGPILAMLFAVKELLDRREGEACAGLPCNLSFIFEVCCLHTRPATLLLLIFLRSQVTCCCKMILIDSVTC